MFLDCQSFSSQGTVPIRDTPFLLKYLVSRAEKGAEVMFSLRDTPLMSVFMFRGGIWVQGICFLSATHSFGGKNLYRELEIGGIRVILSAIHPFC